jgi:uncharacterized protein YukE
MSEYTGRYAGMSHRALYEAVRAGDPAQVDGLAAQWRSIGETTRRLADELTRDLGALARGWQGAAGEEYQRRLSLVSGYAGRLADDHQQVSTGLGQMHRALAEARRKAEDPAATDDHDSLLKGVGTGALSGAPLGPTGMLVTGVVGGILGHEADQKQKEQAHQRMVQLVAELAADYDVLRHGHIHTPATPPVGLPGGDPGHVADPTAGGRPGALGQGPHAGAGGALPTGRESGPTGVAGGGAQPAAGAGDPSGPGAGPGAGDPARGGPAGGGTSLAGAADDLAGGGGALLAGSALAGQVGALPAAAGAAAAGSATALGSGAAAALAGSLPPGGVLGGAAGATGAHGAHGAPGAHGAHGAPGSHGGAGTAGTPGAGGTAGTAPGHGPAAGRAPQAGAAGRAAAGVPGSRGADGEEPERYDTWLTEDEIVWGDDEAPPPVLGAPAPAPGPAGPVDDQG